MEYTHFNLVGMYHNKWYVALRIPKSSYKYVLMFGFYILYPGIRFHFHKLVKGFTLKSSGTAQLGLGHSYSRAKVKFNVNRVDNMIIQSIALLDQLDKDINTFSMRIR
jgi:hypothetical protein